MTRVMMELGLGLYVMAGVELAEWGLRRPDVTKTVAPGEPGKRYLLMVAIGPLWAMWVGLFVMVIAIDRGVLWAHYLISGGSIRFWTIVIMTAAILILNMVSPSMFWRAVLEPKGRAADVMNLDVRPSRRPEMIVDRIRYTVGDDRIEENKKAVGAFIAEVAALDGASYTSFQIGDAGEFMHLAIFERKAAKARFFALPGFQAFADGLKQRARAAPEVDNLMLVASSLSEL